MKEGAKEGRTDSSQDWYKARLKEGFAKINLNQTVYNKERTLLIDNLNGSVKGGNPQEIIRDLRLCKHRILDMPSYETEGEAAMGLWCLLADRMSEEEFNRLSSFILLMFASEDSIAEWNRIVEHDKKLNQVY